MILLARHGETDDNVAPLRFQGQRDTPLNDNGRAQARELAERVAALERPVTALYASDLSRARETAEIVGERIGLVPRLDARLREGWRGEWEGFLFEEIERQDPVRYVAWRAPDSHIGFHFPGGETLKQQQERVLETLKEIAFRPAATASGSPSDAAFRPAATASGSPSGDVALVVCHGGSIRTVLCHGHVLGLAAFHDFEVPNVALVEVDPEGLR
jgi:probable phosphoglycerate mutase